MELNYTSIPQLLIFHNEEDRIEIRNWLERKKRLGEIIAHSVAIGDISEKELDYSALQSFMFQTTYIFRSPIILFITNFFPRVRVLDKFRFKFISLITGAYMHKGYTMEVRQKNRNNNHILEWKNSHYGWNRISWKRTCAEIEKDFDVTICGRNNTQNSFAPNDHRLSCNSNGCFQPGVCERCFNSIQPD